MKTERCYNIHEKKTKRLCKLEIKCVDMRKCKKKVEGQNACLCTGDVRFETA